MGSSSSKNIIQVRSGSSTLHPNYENNTALVPTPAVSQVVIRPSDHENADVNCTKTDKEQFTPPPPRVANGAIKPIDHEKADTDVTLIETHEEQYKPSPPKVAQVLIRPFDRENADVTLTLADEKHYMPKPPRVSRNELISDFSVFRKIDQHAQSVPNKFCNSIKELANYLTHPCTTDVEIVRAFYIWICHNISYDVTKTLPNDSNSVVRSGMAKCAGYSNVFASLCRITGIKVKIVTGYAKGASYSPEKSFKFKDETNHAWNAVYIQDEWRFIECTWGSGSVTQERYIRSVNDIYFLMEPLLMINAHFPYMNVNEPNNSQNWQLLDRPRSLREFNNDVKLYKAGLEWGVVISPNKALLSVDKITQIEIKATKTQLVDIMASLNFNGTRIQGSLYIEQINPGTFKCTLRPPSTGKYELNFFGKVTNDAKTQFAIVTMALDVHSVQNNVHPYPNRFTAYGYNGAAGRGLVESMKYGQIFLKKSGELDILVKKEKGFRFSYKLEHSEVTLVDGKNYVFNNLNDDTTAIAHLRLPYKGFYELQIFSQIPEATDTTFAYAASCLVECVKPTDLGHFPHVFNAANDLGCTLIQPRVRDLKENTYVQFVISCQNLVVAKVKSLPDMTKFPLKQKGYLWTGDVKIPSAGQELVVKGNNVNGTLQSLFKFKAV